jgi:hypothetical protein
MWCQFDNPLFLGIQGCKTTFPPETPDTPPSCITNTFPSLILWVGFGLLAVGSVGLILVPRKLQLEMFHSFQMPLSLSRDEMDSFKQIRQLALGRSTDRFLFNLRKLFFLLRFEYLSSFSGFLSCRLFRIGLIVAFGNQFHGD